VYDIDTGEGIPGVSIFLQNGDKFVTDNKGLVNISGKGNLKGQIVTTTTGIQGYGVPGYYKHCNTRDSYEIFSDELLIPLEKENRFRLVVKAKNSNNQNWPIEACLLYGEMPCSNEPFYLDIVLEHNGTLFRPPGSEQNTLTGVIPNDGTEQVFKLFYNNNCSDLSAPDSIFSIPIIQRGTSEFIIYI
jgi:hypothetical protein